MSKGKKTKQTLLIASIFLSTASCGALQFPNVYQYSINLHDQVCTKRQYIDREQLIVKVVETFPLVEGGPCDSLIGHSFKDYNEQVKPWTRSVIETINTKPKANDG